jgi:multiple sugar transport system permease protein
MTQRASTFRLAPKVFVVLRYLLLAVSLIWACFPTLFMVLSSFKPASEIWAYPPKLITVPTLENYEELIRFHPEYGKALWNSFATTVLAVIATLLVAIGAAYVFSRMRMGWLKLPAAFLLTIRMFPPIIVIIPLFPIFSRLGLMDTMAPIVIAGVAFSTSIAIMLLKSFIDSIPPELEEAAMIDGCSRFGAFMRITLRLIAPGLAAIVAFVGISMWNEYLIPLVFTSSNARTAPVSIAIAMAAPDGLSWGTLLSMATIHLAPMVLLVLVLHEPLVKGMTVGAVKG